MFPIKQKRQFAFNKLFNVLIVIDIICAGISAECFIARDIPWAIGFGLAALFFFILPALFTPYGYFFDSEGVSLHYVFFPVERYLWNDIHAITFEDIATGTRRCLSVEFFYAFVFSLHGRNVGKSRFYMKGYIRRSFRTKHLLETYWDGTITGYMFEDVKKWIAKRKAKQQKYIQAHLTDEIAPMEREIRADIRAWLTPFIAQAKQRDLFIKTNYWYITNDFRKLRSRPKEGYTYTLVAEIAAPNETNEDHILVVHIELLYVRLGKTAYRGVKNKFAKEELESTFADVFKSDELSNL